ncbi:MAG: protein kinase [Ardenticatenaceae bacterium]|nr:protein kinase [Ardenticatenaceae bacterium]
MMQDLIDQQIGHYLIEELIGKGGIAKVYKAYDERFKRHVAIKILNRHELDIELVKERFEQEAQIIAALEHHAIVPVYDFSEHEGRPFIVMRLMRGGSLRDRLVNGPLTIGTAAHIFERLCSSLDRAHDSGIIHRDIKPANILFDSDDVAFLADFGMARFTQLTISGMIIGSPHYMSPEQSKGMRLDRRSDVYQLGVVLYEMLTGRIPFDGESIDSVLYQHVHEPPTPMRELIPELPQEIDLLVQQALAKDRDERLSSAGELAKRLRALSDAVGASTVLPISNIFDEDDLSTSPSPSQSALADTLRDTPTPSALFSARSRFPWSLLAGVFVGLVTVSLVIGGWFLFDMPGRLGLEAFGENIPELAAVEAETAATPTARAEVAISDDPPEEVEAPTSTVDVTTLLTLEPSLPAVETESVFVVSAAEIAAATGATGLSFGSSPINDQASDLTFDIFHWGFGGNQVEQLTTIEVDDLRPVWSPDRQSLVYHSKRGNWEIYVVDENGGNRVNITESQGNDTFPVWTPDGRIIFQSDRNGGQFDLYIVDRDGENLERLTNSGQDDTAPTVSADGLLAYVSQIGAVDQIMVMDLETGLSNQITFDERYGAYAPAWSPNGRKIAFWSNRGNGPKIYVMNADGSLPIVLTDISDSAFFPYWSPNGDWIVFHRAMSSEDDRDNSELVNRDLWMVRADGSELMRLTNTPDDQERMPVFRP